MEIDAESLHARYQQMETEELIALYRRGHLTEIAFGVLSEVLHEKGVRGIDSAVRPNLESPICSQKLVEDGREMGLVMSNARLNEVLTDWRSRRAAEIGEIILATCGYAGIAAIGVMFAGSIESTLGQIALAFFIAAMGGTAVLRALRVIEAVFGNERVRHMKAVLKAGGYPAAEVAAADAARIDVHSPARAVRATCRYSFVPTPSPKVINVRIPDRYSLDDTNIASDAFLQTYEWRKLRMEALKRHGARCQCCGARTSKTDGVVINVDHIKPRKHFPELALDIDNLQVLCNVCNHGKGNWDMTDWRNTE